MEVSPLRALTLLCHGYFRLSIDVEMKVSPLRALTQHAWNKSCILLLSRNESKPVEGIDTLSCSSMPEWVKRDAIRKEEILSAVVKSGRSYEEIMNFLNAGSDGEKTEK